MRGRQGGARRRAGRPAVADRPPDRPARCARARRRRPAPSTPAVPGPGRRSPAVTAPARVAAAARAGAVRRTAPRSGRTRAGGPGGSGCPTTCGAPRSVAGDLLYVTSFEVHALDVATGRRQFKTRDVAWTMAVADGRIHASDGPRCTRSTPPTAPSAGACGRRLGVLAPGRRRAPSSPARAAAASRRGTRPPARSCGSAAARRRTSSRRRPARPWSTAPSTTAAAAGCTRWTRAPVPSAGRTRSATPSVVRRRAGAAPVVADGRRLPDRGHPGPRAGRGRRHRALALRRPGGDLLRPPAPGPRRAAVSTLADYLGTVYALDRARRRASRWRVATEARQCVEPVLVAAARSTWAAAARSTPWTR